jgi:hypothetical protein
MEIEIGDECYYEITGMKFIAIATWKDKFDEDFCFKIIKKISKEAGWVRDGDEFDINEIQPYNEPFDIIADIKYLNKDVVTAIRIFNHSCGHFH